MVKNQDVINSFVNGGGVFEKTKHLFIEKQNNNLIILYSYGYHYPLCIKLLDNTFLINSNGYSNTTAHHKSLLCCALKNTSFKELQKNIHSNILFFSTEKLKEILQKGFLNKNQIIEEKI